MFKQEMILKVFFFSGLGRLRIAMCLFCLSWGEVCQAFWMLAVVGSVFQRF